MNWKSVVISAGFGAGGATIIIDIVNSAMMETKVVGLVAMVFAYAVWVTIDEVQP